ncbi:MAG: hypothetical protein U5K00_07710 [Melioribacteraceae bacterium]|nr:hypothetical protein [Melioribacteraceae bacterium]
MALFQKSALNKYLQSLDQTNVQDAFHKFKELYVDKNRIGNIALTIQPREI